MIVWDNSKDDEIVVAAYQYIVCMYCGLIVDVTNDPKGDAYVTYTTCRICMSKLEETVIEGNEKE